MALDFLETYGLVDAAAAAAGNQVVTLPHNGFRHLFLVTISVAANVWIEAAATPVPPGATRWVRISGNLTATDSVAVEGNFRYLRVSWSGNTGTVSVDLIQSAQQPDVY
jgi:hypothetical protein